MQLYSAGEEDSILGIHRGLYRYLEDLFTFPWRAYLPSHQVQDQYIWDYMNHWSNNPHEEVYIDCAICEIPQQYDILLLWKSIPLLFIYGSTCDKLGTFQTRKKEAPQELIDG